MTTLYLDRRDLRLKHVSGAIAVYVAGKRESTVPLNLLERVVLRGSVELDTGLLGSLAEAGVGVLMLSGRNGRRRAMLLGGSHGDVLRRLNQVRLYDDPVTRVRWARQLVYRKLVAQRRLLRQAMARRPDCRRPLFRALETIERLCLELRDDSDTQSVERLRGLEGAGAAAYFPALATLFPASLGFTGRKRRPPPDPVNSCLSLGYTLLHFEAAQAAHAAGLDPLIGFFHDPAHGRESLASDLIEPLRPWVDRWVWGLFRDRYLRDEHFTRDGAACLLGKPGRARFYGAWEHSVGPARRALRRSTGLVARYLKAVPVSKSSDHD